MEYTISDLLTDGYCFSEENEDVAKFIWIISANPRCLTLRSSCDVLVFTRKWSRSFRSAMCVVGV
jgi:hypothetical protein